MRWLAFIAFLFPVCVNAQVRPVLNKALPVKGSQLYADKLQNIYAVQNDELIQLKLTGEEKNRYSNKALGEITYLDPSNPLKLLLFYRSLSQVVFTDNKLSPRNNLLSLEQLGFPQAKLVCTSYMNGIWVYDQIELGLIRLDKNLQETTRTGNLNQILKRQLDPGYMIEKYNKLYLYDKQQGILVFDVYGTYAKTIPIKGIDQFQIYGNLIYYLKNHNVFIYDQVGLDEQSFPIPQTEVKDILIVENQLWTISGKGIYIYDLK